MKTRRLTFPALGAALAVAVLTAGAPGAPAQQPQAAAEPAPTAAEAANRFGYVLLAELLGRDGGAGTVVISPYSLAAALTMAAQGAEGDTRAAFSEALGLGDLPVGEAAAGQAALAEALARDGEDIVLAIANALWGDAGIDWRAGFLETLRARFGAEVRTVDFADPAAAGAINAWVEEQTRGMIPTLVDSLPPDTAMVLANAVYFRGLWQTPFDPERTEDAPFALGGGGSAEVAMMARTDRFRYRASGGTQAVILPYGEGGMELVLVLPPADAPAPDADTLAGWFAPEGFGMRDGTVRLPRLDLTYESSMIDALGALGLGVAFSGAADFSRMADAPLFIGDVLHKTALTLDEEGTEAAAVTGVTVRVTSLAPEPFTLTLDRPFYLAIRDTATGAVLFAGHVADPGTGQPSTR